MPRLIEKTTTPDLHIRYVAHPLFETPDALGRIERLKPSDWDETATPAETRELSPLGRLCQQPLLGRQAERYLFVKMNFEKFQANSAAEGKRAKYLAAASELRNRILLANSRLLVSVAGQFATRMVRTEELVSEGVIPLLKAIDLFDVSRGWAFGTYATHVLRNHFRRIGERRHRRSSKACFTPESLLAEIPDEGTAPQTQLALAEQHRQLAQQCLAELPETDRRILRNRFGFDDPVDSNLKSYAEVGQMVGLSKERVRVRTHRAIEQLQETADRHRWEYPELDSFPLPA